MSRSPSPLSLEFVLLGLLRRTPMHAYDMYRAICELDGFDLVWKIKRSHLYALAEKLEALGLLEGDVVPGEGRPARRVFRTTPEGLRRFEAWRESPVQSIRDMRQDFFARLHFAREEGPSATRLLLERQRDACRQWRGGLEARSLQGAPDHAFGRLVASHRLRILDATLDWLEATLADGA